MTSFVVTDKRFIEQEEDGVGFLEVKMWVCENENWIPQDTNDCVLADPASAIKHALEHKWGSWVNVGPEAYDDLTIGKVIIVTPTLNLV